ncbi:hypothetical protein GCM10029978_116160 [Actinoallomurus acanthiterrae]
MSWIPVLSTVVGAVIGLGSGLLTEHLRSGRERTGQSLNARRDVYVQYLSALHDANEALRAVSLGEHAPDLTRKAAARAAFRSARITQAREHVILLAPEPVITAADSAYRSLRTLRDRIGQGEQLAQYEPVLMAYGDSLDQLRQAVRRDLGINGRSPRIEL